MGKLRTCYALSPHHAVSKFRDRHNVTCYRCVADMAKPSWCLEMLHISVIFPLGHEKSETSQLKSLTRQQASYWQVADRHVGKLRGSPRHVTFCHDVSVEFGFNQSELSIHACVNFSLRQGNKCDAWSSSCVLLLCVRCEIVILGHVNHSCR